MKRKSGSLKCRRNAGFFVTRKWKWGLFKSILTRIVNYLSESTAVARHELGTPWTQIRMFNQPSGAAQSQPQSQSRSLYWLTYLLLTRLVVYTIYKWTMQLMLIYELIQVQNLSTPYTVNTFHTYMLEYYNNCLINTQFIACTRITVFFLNISHPL